jgi:hypothetical protein
MDSYKLNNKVIISLDKMNYQMLLKMIEKEQKVRDRSYELWQKNHTVTNPKKRKEPLKFEVIKN